MGDPAGADKLRQAIHSHLGEMAFARRLQVPFARLFADLDDEQIDAVMRSFAFENCTVCQPWADAITAVTGSRQSYEAGNRHETGDIHSCLVRWRLISSSKREFLFGFALLLAGKPAIGSSRIVGHPMVLPRVVRKPWDGCGQI